MGIKKVTKSLVRACIELDYTEGSVRCNYYPTLAPETTLLEIGGREYPAIITVKDNLDCFTIKIEVCKDGK
jgi:hypothetical protein